jgi:hypothetical protein
VTTVDVYIRRLDSRESFSLHNALFGPATTVFHAVVDACRNGLAEGEWSGSHAKVKLNGSVLRSLLADIDELDPTFHREGDDAKFAAFRAAIEDGAVYAVDAIEV